MAPDGSVSTEWSPDLSLGRHRLPFAGIAFAFERTQTRGASGSQVTGRQEDGDTRAISAM